MALVLRSSPDSALDQFNSSIRSLELISAKDDDEVNDVTSMGKFISSHIGEEVDSSTRVHIGGVELHRKNLSQIKTLMKEGVIKIHVQRGLKSNLLYVASSTYSINIPAPRLVSSTSSSSSSSTAVITSKRLDVTIVHSFESQSEVDSHTSRTSTERKEEMAGSDPYEYIPDTSVQEVPRIDLQPSGSFLDSLFKVLVIDLFGGWFSPVTEDNTGNQKELITERELIQQKLDQTTRECQDLNNEIIEMRKKVRKSKVPLPDVATTIAIKLQEFAEKGREYDQLRIDFEKALGII